MQALPGSRVFTGPCSEGFFPWPLIFKGQKEGAEMGGKSLVKYSLRICRVMHTRDKILASFFFVSPSVQTVQ